MFDFKRVRSTEKTHAHIEVIENGKSIGYITAPMVNTVSGKWHFTSENIYIESLNADTKKELILKLGDHVKSI